MTEESSRSTQDREAFAILAHGTSAIDNQAARRGLGLADDVEDDRFALTVVQQVARASKLQLRDPGLSTPAPPSPAPSAASEARASIPVPRPSYILRLPASTDAYGLSLKTLDDVRTLLSMLRAGALFQRRAAVLRIGERLLGDSELGADARKRAVDALTEQRGFDLGYETAKVLGSLPGGDGRTARAEQRARHERATRIEAQVLAFWDGEQSREPIAELGAEERAQLLTRARELSDVLSRHLAALIEDAGLGTPAARRVLVSSLEYAGDPRLLPALRSLLYSQDADLFAPCVRALARIEDPRVRALLRDAYERATRSQERLCLSAALGCQGDTRGLSYVRSVLSERDPALLLLALEALAETGGKEDVQQAIELLDQDNLGVAHAAVRTLGRIGDGRALVPLADLRARVQASSLRGEIEEAEAAIAARAELLGEAAPSAQAASLAWDTRRMVAKVRAKDPTLVRVRARLYHGFAYVWLLVGAVQRAVARFEAAAALRPGWLAPVLALALLYGRMQDVAPALSAFRRALDIDRAEVEGDSRAVTALAKAFLRRAEAMERAGRLDIARGLIEEVLSYDLRRANGEVRLALSERRDAHRTRER